MVTQKEVILIFKEYIDQVMASPLLASFSQAEIQHFLSTNKFKIISYTKNSVLHFDGELCNRLEIILSGKIIIDRIDESGNLLSISDFSDGDILGGNLMFSSNPYYLMTVATASDSIILEIPKDLLFELLSSNKAFLKAYLEFISEHTSILGNKIKHYIKRSIRDSIVNYLKHEFKKQNSYTIKLAISKKLLADRIGVQRTSLSRELKKMQDDGLITFDSKSITIKDQRLLST